MVLINSSYVIISITSPLYELERLKKISPLRKKIREDRPPFALQFPAKSNITEAKIFCKSFSKIYFFNILKIEQENSFPDFSFPTQFKTKKVRLHYVKKFAIPINDFGAIYKRHPAMSQKYHI